MVPEVQSTDNEPQFIVSAESITGKKDVPLLFVYQSPPEAYAT